jgi:hypothetical protein
MFFRNFFYRYQKKNTQNDTRHYTHTYSFIGQCIEFHVSRTTLTGSAGLSCNMLNSPLLPRNHQLHRNTLNLLQCVPETLLYLFRQTAYLLGLTLYLYCISQCCNVWTVLWDDKWWSGTWCRAAYWRLTRETLKKETVYSFEMLITTPDYTASHPLRQYFAMPSHSEQQSLTFGGIRQDVNTSTRRIILTRSLFCLIIHKHVRLAYEEI